MAVRDPEPADAVARRRTQLFRSEVVEARRGRIARNHRIAGPVSWTWIAILILLSSIEMLAFVALLSHYHPGMIGRPERAATTPR